MAAGRHPTRLPTAERAHPRGSPQSSFLVRLHCLPFLSPEIGFVSVSPLCFEFAMGSPFTQHPSFSCCSVMCSPDLLLRFSLTAWLPLSKERMGKWKQGRRS